MSYSLKYLTRLEFSHSDSLLKLAFETSKSVPLKKTWASSSQSMKQFVLTHSTLDEITIMNKKLLKLFLLENYKKYWVNKINSEPKLRTFRKFKTQFGYEEYLNLNNTRHRKTMTRFRISAHRLAIEQGR